MSAVAWCGAAVLGGVGAVARVTVAAALARRFRGAFPLGTFTVNVTGSFLLGLLAGTAASGDLYRLAGIALLGSYTTFSTWMLEARSLQESGRRRLALAYLVLTLAVGLGAVALGRALATQL